MSARRNRARRINRVVSETSLEGRKVVKQIVVIKCCVMLGLIASYFLPQGAAVGISIAANMLWLWKA